MLSPSSRQLQEVLGLASSPKAHTLTLMPGSRVTSHLTTDGFRLALAKAGFIEGKSLWPITGCLGAGGSSGRAVCVCVCHVYMHGAMLGTLDPF